MGVILRCGGDVLALLYCALPNKNLALYTEVQFGGH